MKILEKDGRTNFIDENNVVLGFETWSQCCEDFHYAMHKNLDDAKTHKNAVSVDITVGQWVFDKYFFAQSSIIYDKELDNKEGGESAIFRLINSEGGELFLALWNFHNGYYSHNFNLAVGGKTIYEGKL